MAGRQARPWHLVLRRIRSHALGGRSQILTISHRVGAVGRHFGLLRGIMQRIGVIFNEVVLVRHHDHLAGAAERTSASSTRGGPHVQRCVSQRGDAKLVAHLTHAQRWRVRAVDAEERAHRHGAGSDLTADKAGFRFVVRDCAQRERTRLLLSRCLVLVVLELPSELGGALHRSVAENL